MTFSWVNFRVLHWNHSMAVDCWKQLRVSWLPTHVLVGASAAVTINNTQARQFKCTLRFLMCLLTLLPYSQPPTPHSIVHKLYMCIHLHKCSRYIQLYLNYRVDFGLLHTCRSDLIWELNTWKTNFYCSLLMSSTLLWSNKIW
jgi:hypothetical protein